MATAAAVLAGRAWGVDYVPVVSGSLMGGQYFYQGASSNLGANASLLAAPTFKTSDRWTFLPVYDGDYQGTKGVSDIVGPGTLFQQEFGQLVSVTAVDTPDGSAWRFKPTASYKYEFLKETRDEAWGKGLFDFEKAGAGFEAERVYKEPFSYRFGLDVFQIRFPNYASLESQAGTDPTGDPLNRELAAPHVLDSWNVQLSASGSRPFPYDAPVMAFEAGYSLLYQYYPEQNLVDSEGNLENRVRQDYIQTVTGSMAYPRPLRLMDSDMRVDAKLTASASLDSSNQNTFDPVETQYVGNDYSYLLAGVGPTATLNWGNLKRPTWASLGVHYERQQYLGRLAQDSDGLYTAAKEHDDRYVMTLGYGYPIAEGFYLKAQGNFYWQRSNMTYEVYYPYNYRTSNFLLGFTYDY